MGARLQGAVERGASRIRAGFLERMHFRVRLSGPLVRALPDDDAFARDDTGADHRVGRGPPESEACVIQRPSHEPDVVCGYHFSWKMASTYSRGENGIRSSMPSP